MARLKGHNYVFDICTKERTYHIAAETPTEKFEWMKTLNELLFTSSLLADEVGFFCFNKTLKMVIGIIEMCIVIYGKCTNFAKTAYRISKSRVRLIKITVFIGYYPSLFIMD